MPGYMAAFHARVTLTVDASRRRESKVVVGESICFSSLMKKEQ